MQFSALSCILNNTPGNFLTLHILLVPNTTHENYTFTSEAPRNLSRLIKTANKWMQINRIVGELRRRRLCLCANAIKD